jgi:competence protein ComEC
VELAEEYGAEIHYVAEDMTLRLGDAVLQIFAPVGDGGGNEEGLSILCSAGEYDALITGDMNRSNEKVLAAEKNLPDLEVLLVGHHGAANATSEELLNAVTPEVGIISVGENAYGHPNEETMQRMVRRDMTIYRTDLQGNISLVLP